LNDESIVVIDRTLLPKDAAFTGIRKGAEPFLHAIGEHWFSASRQIAEECPGWKQPIPYIIVRRLEEIFVTRRRANIREARLREKISIGIGGHLRPGSHTDFSRLLLENAHRELHEELVISPEVPIHTMAEALQFLGVINDDRDDVGRCHIGFLYVLDLPIDTTVSVREHENLAGEFRDLESIPIDSNTESWSVLALRLLKGHTDRC